MPTKEEYEETAALGAAVIENASNVRFEQEIRQPLLWQLREHGLRHTFWVCVYKYLVGLKGVE